MAERGDLEVVHGWVDGTWLDGEIYLVGDGGW